MKIMRRVAPLCAMLLAACSGDGDSAPVTPPPTPTIALALASTAGTVARSSNTTIPVSITRGGGYTGAVTLAASGAPAGVAVAFEPASLSSATTASVATITVGSTAAPGSATITITASGTGVTAASTTYALTIPTPTIGVAVAAPTVSITQGTAANVGVTVTRSNGFADAITLVATGAPTGVTATFAPASVAAGATASTLAFAVTGDATPGSYPITITGSGTGVANATANVTLTVTAAATPAFGLSASPAALSITAGQSSTSALTAARTGGFAGEIALMVSGAPAGMTASVAPSALAANATTSTLSVATTTAVVAGTYAITVSGTGPGVQAQSTTVSVTVAAAPGVTISAIAAQQLSQGTSSPTAIPIVLTRTGGLAGDLTMSLEGAPTGVTAAFSPNPATASGTQMTLSAAAGTVPGTYPLTVRATGAGGASGTQSFSLTVTAAAAGSFALNVAPSTLSVVQGQTGLATMNIARAGGFTGAVTLSATGVPNGTTATFTPAAPTGTQAQLGLQVGAGTAAGSYTITIRGQGAGVADVTTTLTLTVTPSGGGTGNVNWTFCEAARFPLWFAVQNGTDGAWTAVTPTGTNTRVYTFSVTTVGGVAYAIPRSGGGTDVTVQYLSAAELTAGGSNECVTNRPTKSLTGSVANVPAGASAFIGSGGATATVSGPATAFSLSGVDDGLTDVVGIRSAFDLATLSLAPDRGILRRNVNYAAGSAMPVLDLTGSESFAVTSANYTVTNAGGDQVISTASLLTANGFAGTFSFPTASGLGATQKIFGVPSSLTANGDLHQVLITAFSGSGLTTSSRILAQYNRDLVNRSITLGPSLTAPTIASLGATPYVRLSASGPWQAEYGDAVGVGFTQSTANSNSWTMAMSRSYAGGGGTWTLALPDFTAVTGFNASWALAGAATNWSVSATGGLIGFAGAGVTGFGENGSFRAGARTGTITP